MFSSTNIGRPKAKGGGKKMLRVWQHRAAPSSDAADSSSSPHTTPTKSAHARTNIERKSSTASTTASTGVDTPIRSAPNSPTRGDGGGGPVIQDCFSDLHERYEVDPAELGSGQYGVVRKCTPRDKPDGEVLAVKTIRKSRVSQLRILRQEVQLLGEVSSHPHIIKLVDVFEDKDDVHLVTELCTGGELFDRIIARKEEAAAAGRAGCYTETEAAVIVRQILDAVAYCHDEKDIVHRDLKPENFLLSSEEDDADVKIIDFGYAVRHLHGDKPLRDDVGTPLYMAPEVIAKKYERKCDVWSVGVIAYTLLAGHPPFNGIDERSICESVSEGRFRFNSPNWDGVGVEAKDFICKVLKKDPKMRMTAGEARRHQWIRKVAPCEGDEKLDDYVSPTKSKGSPKKGGKKKDPKLARRMLSPSRFTY